MDGEFLLANKLTTTILLNGLLSGQLAPLLFHTITQGIQFNSFQLRASFVLVARE